MLIPVAQAADNPPWVSPIQVSSLANDGKTISGDVQISVTAGDDLGVSKVEFYSADGQYLIGTKTSPPYNVKWATDPWVPDGEQIIKVIAYDKTGHKAGTTRKVYIQNDKVVPSTPTNLRTTAKTNNSISLAWSAATDNVGVAGYDIYNGQARIGTSTSTSVTLNELKPGTTYHLLVKARDRAGNISAASNTINVTTNDLPPTVSSIAISPLDMDGETVSGNVKLSVTANDDSGISKVEFYSKNGGYLIGTKTSEPYSITWATDPWVPDGGQVVKAVAYDLSGQKAEATQNIYVQNDKSAPSTPTNLHTTEKNNTSLSLAWSASTDNVGVVSYDIYNGQSLIGTSTSTSITLNDLTPGTMYHLSAKAKDRAGNVSEASNTINEATKDLPPTVSPLEVSPVESDGETVSGNVKLSITAKDDTGISKVEFYSANGQYLIGARTSEPYSIIWATDPWVPDGEQVVKAIAYDQSGQKTETSKKVNVHNKIGPPAPKNFRLIGKTDHSISLKWDGLSDNYDVTSYSIYQNTVKIMDTTSTNFVVGGLTPSTQYTFYVTAKDVNGQESPASQKLTVSTDSQSLTPPSYVVAGYYAGWSTYSGYDVSDIDATKFTQINYAFANIGDDLRMQVGDPYADIEKSFPGDSSTDAFKGNFNQLKKLKQKYPHLKTVISVGGWSWSGKFSDAALTESSRTVFADSVVKFLVTYGFDGVDFDWEYPVGGGMETNVNRPIDKTNYTLLLQKVREKLDAQQALDGKKYTISIAAGASSSFAENTELDKISKIVDYVQLMTYDFHGPWDSLTGFNSPLNASSGEPSNSPSVLQAVQLFLNKGVPANKLVMGVPFYGYEYKGVNNANNGLAQSYTNVKSINYSTIEKNMIGKNGFIRYWNDDSQVPYLWNGSTFISYDDAESIGKKAAFIKSKGLAGAMIWEISQDPNKVLLNQLVTDLK
ncbi:glycosyl hydrolase family 18 protein [Cytobacillus sp. NCCP-133]|uniref:glycosyl hydrolase family 18 protein n=1 Tax=Cytobacillus sp. NCCP-133 TaxID=766848 RepID=UPI002231DB95|nr:glycosyl hydrolase family 18 protein [Cytobacillus sp. NCCP-133]